MKTPLLFVLAVLAAAAPLLSCKKDPPTAQVTSDVTVATSATDTVSFSGYTWYIKNDQSAAAGPGPNYFSPNNVWVDANGYLHLKLSKDPATGHWECAEVYTVDSLGLGEYQWEVEGRIDTLDENVVLGLFNYSGNDGYDEMDIEYSRWGNASSPILNYTIYPATGTSGALEYHTTDTFSLVGGDYSTQRFTRYSDSVAFKALYGFQDDNTNLAAYVTCIAPPYSVSNLNMPVHMNLWLDKGLAPANKDSVELIIHSFTYTPL